VTPAWWTRRERLAQALGPYFWPCWYLAPRATRDRWAAMAALMDSEHDSLGARVELLRDHGVDPLRGSGPRPDDSRGKRTCD
jgi:hypothetical protein